MKALNFEGENESIMKNKLERRIFIKKLSVAVVGSFAFAKCSFGTKENQQQTVDSEMEKSIAATREMPRDLVLKLLDQKVDKYMHISYNCAQSSFAALQEQFGLEANDVLKALTPLTGIAERGETCGAVVGALMCFGLIYGRGKTQLADWNTYRKSLIPSGNLCNKFENIYGSTMCCAIQKKKFGECFHLTNPEDLKRFQKSGATERCTTVVQKAVRIAANIILDE